MSRRYSPEHKALVLQTLDRNGDNITVTSIQTGVPERTIRDWRQQRHLFLPENSRRRRQIELPPEIANPEHSKEADVFKYLREQIMRGLLQMVANFAEDMDDATFHQRVNALTKLIDRFPKVTSWLPVDQSNVVTIVYQDPDGSVHDTPPWSRRTATNAWKSPFSIPGDEEYDSPLAAPVEEGNHIP